jgi:hypothetical protein
VANAEFESAYLFFCYALFPGGGVTLALKPSYILPNWEGANSNTMNVTQLMRASRLTVKIPIKVV